MIERGLMRHWKWGTVLAAAGLVGLLVPLGSAQAREIYCASDAEAADLHGGVLQVILGPRTQLVQDSNTPDGRTNTVWSGQAQQCPPTAKDDCQGRVDHAEATSYTHMVSFTAAADLTGTGTAAHWAPILSASYGYSKTNNYAQAQLWRVADVTADASGSCSIQALHPPGATSGYYVTTDSSAY